MDYTLRGRATSSSEIIPKTSGKASLSNYLEANISHAISFVNQFKHASTTDIIWPKLKKFSGTSKKQPAKASYVNIMEMDSRSVNTDWARSKTNRRTTTGIVLWQVEIWFHETVRNKYWLQNHTEAEYRAMADGCWELRLRILLEELIFKQSGPTTIHCDMTDNKTCRERSAS